MTTIKVQERGVITLPKKIRDEVGIERDTLIDIETRDGVVVMRPRTKLDADLLVDVHAALRDLKTGNFIEFSSIQEFHRKRKQKWGRGKARA